MYDYVVGTREFTTAAEFAERVNCSETGARTALEQLVEMGIAERRDTRPAGYRRNESYFHWKRIEELAREHSAEELRKTVEELIDADATLQDKYGVPAPNSLPSSVFESTDHETVQMVWEDVTAWRTIRRDIEVLQQAAHRAERTSNARDGVSA